MTIYREFEDIIKDCDKIRIVNFLKTLFKGDSKGKGKFGGTEQPAADGITILGSVTLFTQDGHPKPILCCAKQMDGILTERSSRRKQFDIAVKVLKNNFINPYMGNGPIQGSFTQGLFFFFDEPGNFRLSLVTCDIVSGKMELNNYRRQSFFIEASKRNNTFRNRLCEQSPFPSFDDFKAAFDVEKLSDDFFREYKVFYEDIVQYITGFRYVEESKNNYIRKKICAPCHEIFDQFTDKYGEGENKAERAVRNYIKKMMGRLVFIQFLQKKGWLGIPSSQSEWRGGDTDFLQNIFIEVSPEDRENFVDNILEEIFFGEFNCKENERKIKNKTLIKYKFPFLNCGLFDRDADDKFKCTLPKTFFSNEKFKDTNRKAFNYRNWKEKRTCYFNEEACGLFEFFDRFNFTIDENDPTDAEVSVDPEMLGKIFENLLEENKDKGTFYTPKEIVNYMVNESLIAYLETECTPKCHSERGNSEVEESKIRNFVLTQDTTPFNDREKATLEDKLAEVKICDPAIGSGAFPMGLLNLLCKCRLALKPIEEREKRSTIATFKRDIIQQNIYGVDIEKGAVDIARLRFWLSLIVDEESPEVLPNLEFKIMQGNSLLENYEGIDLSGIAGERKNRTRAQAKQQTSLIFDEKQAMEQIQKDLNKFYKTESHTEKESLTLSINNGVKNYIKYIAPQKSTEIEAMPVPNDKFFLWHTYFRDVFDRKGKSGFDIVIGNPPYIKEYTNKSAFNGFRETSPYYMGKMDLWYGFACHGLDLLGKNGHLCFIAQNNWTTSTGAKKLRKKIASDGRIKQLLDFNTYMVFENASIQTMIMLFEQNNTDDNYIFDYRTLLTGANKADALQLLLKKNTNFTKYQAPIFSRVQFRNKLFTFSENDNLLNSISQNKEFLLDSEIAQGIVFPQDFLDRKGAEKLNNNYSVGSGIFGLSSSELKSMQLNQMEKNLIQPYFTTEQIFRYYTSPQNTQWLIYTDSSFKNKKRMKDYPNIKSHLDKFAKILTSDNKPYGLHRARKQQFFQGEKIISLRKCPDRPCFSYSNFDCYVTQTFFSIKTSRWNMKFLTGVLNSQLVAFWLKNKGKMQGGNYQIDKEPLLSIPLPIATPAQQKPIIDLVDSILTEKKKNPKANTSEQEKEIDKRVYDLYGLTEPEINIIKGQNSSPSNQYGKRDCLGDKKNSETTINPDFLQGENL